MQLFGPATVTHAELAARRPGEKTDDDVFLALRHESGVTSHLWMNMLCAQQGPRFRLLGSDGGFTKHGVDPQEPFIVAGGSPLDAGLRGRRPGLGRAAGPGRAPGPAAHRARRLPGVLPDPGSEDPRRRGGLGAAGPGGPGRPGGGAAADRAGPDAGLSRLNSNRLLRNCRFGGPKGRLRSSRCGSGGCYARPAGYAETSSCQSATRGRLCASETERCATLPPAMLRPAARAASRSNAALTPRLARATA